MKFEIKNLPDSQKEILVKFEFEELEPFIEDKAKEKGKEIEMKGFRKGKVPEEMVQFLLKENLLEEVAQEIIKKAYLRIVKEQKLETLGPPKVEILRLAPNNPFEFKITVSVLPEIQLPNYKSIASQVKKRKVSVEEKEIDETLRWIQKSRAKRYPKEGPAEFGDFLEITWSSPDIEQGREHQEGIVLGESYLLPDFEKELMGMKKGEKKEFQVTFPPNYFNKALANKKAQIKAKVLKIEKLELPKIDDNWAKSLGKFEGLQDLRKSIREGIEAEKTQIESQRVQGEILERVSKATSFEIPKVLIEIELKNTFKELKENIPQMLGIPFSEYLKGVNQTETEFKNSLLPEVRAKVKKFLILREIKKKEGIRAEEEEIKREADKFLSRFRTKEEAERNIDPESLREYIRERIENQKTLEFLESFATKEQ